MFMSVNHMFLLLKEPRIVTCEVNRLRKIYCWGKFLFIAIEVCRILSSRKISCSI